MKKCPICGSVVPRTRKKSAKYCSDECYYEAKMHRSIVRYSQIKSPAEELKRCERILGYLHSMVKLNKTITAADLEALNFNFGISTSERIDNKGRLYKVINQYAYVINADKTVIIWSLN